MEKEFNLSEMFLWDALVGETIRAENVKEFIKKSNDEDSDWIEDILDLIEIHKGSKQDLIIKMKRLCIAHYNEKQKLAGPKLIK